MSDEEIISLLNQEKYHPATKKLYSYYPVVKKFILKNSGSRQEAEDVFQDALVVLFGKVKNTHFELSSTLNTYIFSVSRLLWLEELRKKNKQPRSEFSLQYEEHGGIVEDIEADSKVKLAQQAIESLGQKCRELLQLFYYQKLSMKEISVRLKFASEKVAKNQKYRCIEKAKEFLKNN